jgi:hypothetical protein
MSGNKATLTTQSGMSTLVRARFGPGMLLHHDDLEQLNAYTRELSRLLFRSFFGCGIVCGLKVDTSTKCGKIWVTVEAGLALDCCGDPVYVPKDQTFTIDEKCDPSIPPKLWVLLCGKAKCCAPRTPVCSTDDNDAPPVCTRERDGFELRVVSKLPDCVCGCPHATPPTEDEKKRAGGECRCVDPRLHMCYCDHYAGKCGCHCDDGADCACECILLARLDKPSDDNKPWHVHHEVRRFIRPVLMVDPEVYPLDCKSAKPVDAEKQQTAQELTQQVAEEGTEVRAAEPGPPSKTSKSRKDQ